MVQTPVFMSGSLTRGIRPYPIILGHEIVGRVVELGKEAKKRLDMVEGDRVVLEYAFGCGACRFLSVRKLYAL